MYEFLDRLINIAMPRIRDFRGVNCRAFDGRGNYTLGIKEQIIFPEIEYDQVDAIRGMDIVMCTSAETNAEAYALLKGFQHAVHEISGKPERIAIWRRKAQLKRTISVQRW